MARPARPEPKVFCDAEKPPRAAWSGTTAPASRTPTDEELARRQEHQLPRGSVGTGPSQPTCSATCRWSRCCATRCNGRSRTGGSAPRTAWRPEAVEEALRDDLARESPGPRPPRSPRSPTSSWRYMTTSRPGWRRFRTRPMCCSSRSCWRTYAPVRLWYDLGVDPEHGPPTASDPVNQQHRRPTCIERDFEGRLESYFEASNGALSAHLGRTLLVIGSRARSDL